MALTRSRAKYHSRIDIHVEVVSVPFKELTESREGEKSNLIRERVVKARDIQEERFNELEGIYSNAQMSSK